MVPAENSVPVQPLPPPNETAAIQFLQGHGWPDGIQHQLIKGAAKLPVRFVIVDNSGSMMSNDGQRLVAHGHQYKFIQCSRWTELIESVRFFATLAEAARTPTEFRLLNGANPIMVGIGDDNGQRYRELLQHLEQSPNGGTPLCLHISEVVAQITALAPQLRANNQKAALIIATDGEASDGDIASAMAPLRNLPVWVVIRLCTDEERVLKYWNEVDSQLEVDIEVLDDFESEAREVAKLNDWFTYCEPIHRIREFGVLVKEIDLIDEAPLSTDQMRSVVALLLTAGPASEIPHPDLDWRAFTSFVGNLNSTLPKVWCPIKKRVQPRINMGALSRRYHKGSKRSCTVS